MSENRKYKGYYCKRCHNYTRLYLNEAKGVYEGRCSKCGRQAEMIPDYPGQGLFHSQIKRRTDTINLRESYQGGRIIATIPVGTPARVLRQERYNGIIWYEIESGNLKGWVSGNYIRKLKG